MNKGQISFGFAGLLFGFLVGFVIAHEMYAGRGFGFQHPPIPAGMAAGGGRPAPAAPPRGNPMGAGGPSGEPSMETMEAVRREIDGLKKLIEEDPKNVKALTRLGDLYFDAGMFDRAREFYDLAIGLNPGDVNVRTDLGTALRNLGRPGEALGHFETAVQQDPSHWKGWFNIGVVALYDLHDFERARRAFDRVEELRPGSIDLTALRREIEDLRRRHEAAGGGS